MGEEYLKLVKFIKYYSQFKLSQMSKEDERGIIKRFLDSFDDELDYSKVLSDDSREHPTDI